MKRKTCPQLFFFLLFLQVFWFHYEAPSRPQVCLPRVCVRRLHQTCCRVSRVSSFLLKKSHVKKNLPISIYLKNTIAIIESKRGLNTCFCFPAKPFSCIIRSLWRLPVRQRISTWSNAPCLSTTALYSTLYHIIMLHGRQIRRK